MASLLMVAQRDFDTEPVAHFVELARRFACDIKVTAQDGRTADGKDVMALMSLAVAASGVVDVRAEGRDADEALAALTELDALAPMVWPGDASGPRGGRSPPGMSRALTARALVIGVLAAMYGCERYTAWFGEQQGFVYHPASDALYEVTFVAATSPSFRWDFLVPFREPPVMVPFELEYRGQLHALLAEQAEALRMQSEHPDSYLTALEVEFQALADSLREGGVSQILNTALTTTKIEFLPRHDLEVTTLVPDTLLALLPHDARKWRGITVGDAVILESAVRLAGGRFEQARLPEVTHLREAVLLRGDAALAMRRVVPSP